MCCYLGWLHYWLCQIQTLFLSHSLSLSPFAHLIECFAHSFCYFCAALGRVYCNLKIISVVSLVYDPNVSLDGWGHIMHINRVLCVTIQRLSAAYFNIIYNKNMHFMIKIDKQKRGALT